MSKVTTQGNENSLEQFGYEQKLNRVLGLPSVVLFGFAYLAPCTIFSYYGLIQGSTHGMMSLSYLVATIAMFFTALSYRQMVKAYPIAGSVYNYVGRSMNGHVGFLSGWAILMDYILLPMINYVIASNYIPVLIPGLPPWVFILIMIVVVTTINLVGVKFMSSFDNVLILIQLAFVIATVIFAIRIIIMKDYDILNVKGIFNIDEFGNVGVNGIVSGSAILCLCFLGFDSVTTLAEECHDPGKTVGRALIIVCLCAGAVFVVCTYLFQLAWPDGWKSLDPDNGSYQLVGYLAGQFMGTLLCVIMLVACLGSALSSQASCARILFSMGRDNQLPKKFFGHVSEKHQVPSYNLILIGVASISACFLNLETGSTMVNFGALLGFTLVNVSVITHYWVKEKKRGVAAFFKYILLPVLGSIVTIYLFVNLGKLALCIGGVWLLIGFIVLLINTKGFKVKPTELKGE